VEPVTHLLASLALSRAGLKRATRWATPILLTAGLAPDLDFASRAAGPVAYFRLHRAATHSLVGAAALAVVLAAAFWWLGGKNRERGSPRVRFAPALALAAIAIAAHLLLDLGTTYGVRLFWPFSARFYAWDLWAEADPWILLLLAAGVLLPALLALVVREIGARPPRRASRGAWAALALLAVYAAGRGVLHARACALLASHLYHDETPLAVGAFPSSASPFAWRGVADTADTIDTFELSLLPGATQDWFEPHRSRTHFKPHRSAALASARAAPLAQLWLAAARFPLATVLPTEHGYQVEFRDLRYPSGAGSLLMPAAVIHLNPGLEVVSQRLIFGPLLNPGS
jgi:inner membrane protein